jgi:2,3-bisphosphoglycerate-independent phosphoglycerate mutase
MTISLASWSLIDRYGDVAGAVRAIAEIDKILPKLIASIQQVGATVILTAAHGRLEELIDPLTEKINIGPSTNPVPMLIIGQQWQGKSLGEMEIISNDLSVLPISGSLRSIAPTILALLGVNQPSYFVEPLLPASFID